jgi:hypothetical protein
MAVKHSKYRNPAILFELLVRQTTADLVQNKDTKAVKILKKYFVNTELGKEYQLYNMFNTTEKLSESKAEMFISTVLEQRKKLDNEKLNREKYNLIKEIKNNYNIDDFFKAKIDNYKTYASIYTVFESQYSQTVDTKQVLLNKINLLEHITDEELKNKPISATMVQDLMKEDKEIRLLAYKLMVEKFNSKYNNFSERQKEVLKEYINNISETESLKNYLNGLIKQIKTELVEIKKGIEDKVTVIRLNETIKLLNPIKQNESIKDDAISNLLQYIELIDILKQK